MPLFELAQEFRKGGGASFCLGLVCRSGIGSVFKCFERFEVREGDERRDRSPIAFYDDSILRVASAVERVG